MDEEEKKEITKMDLCFVMNRYIDIGKDKYIFIICFIFQPKVWQAEMCLFFFCLPKF